MYSTRFCGPAKPKTLSFPIERKDSDSSSLLGRLAASCSLLQPLAASRYQTVSPPSDSPPISAINNQPSAIRYWQPNQSQGYWQLIRDTGSWEIGWFGRLDWEIGDWKVVWKVWLGRLVVGCWKIGTLVVVLEVGFGRLIGRLVVVLVVGIEDWKVGCWKIGRLVFLKVVGIGRLEGWLLEG